MTILFHRGRSENHGAYVAFMRPPYGSYNQMVLDASGIRGQSVAIWDFEFVFSIIPFW